MIGPHTTGSMILKHMPNSVHPQSSREPSKCDNGQLDEAFESLLSTFPQLKAHHFNNTDSVNQIRIFLRHADI